MSTVMQQQERCVRENRSGNQLRPLNITYNLFGYAPGNVLFEMGNTKVLCSVSMQRGVPHFLKGTRTGWLTAEYSLLPSATLTRIPREGVLLKRNHRSVEISRMIGRALRVIMNLDIFGEQTIVVDCDVLQADGGTRSACLTGAYLALEAAEKQWLEQKVIQQPIIKEALAAISVGIVDGQPLLDLDYQEDSKADADFNFVLTASGALLELQGTAEQAPISWDCFDQLRKLACSGIKELFEQCEKMKKAQGIKKIKNDNAPLFSLQRRGSFDR